MVTPEVTFVLSSFLKSLPYFLRKCKERGGYRDMVFAEWFWKGLVTENKKMRQEGWKAQHMGI